MEIVELLRAVLSTLTELVELNRRLINSVENRSGARSATRYGPDRSATVDEGARLGADAPARMGARLSGPSGPREPLVADNGVARSGTATASEPLDHWEPVSAEIVELVLGSLNGSQSSSTIDAIADHRDLSRSAVAAALRELVLARRVVRLPPASSAPGDAERWQLAAAVESPTETIACTAYREHAIAGHRRDPATGRFRCYLCVPEILEPAEHAGAYP